MNIMLVEDDRIIASGLQYSLEQEQYSVVLAYTYTEAKDYIEKHIEDIHLFIFDLNLPDGTGYDLCTAVKQRQDKPVIFLSAVDEEVNIVMGLDIGADDYITKPFRVRELMSRIKSILRRYQQQTTSIQQRPTTMHIGNLSINTQEAKVFKKGQEIFLTSLEYRLFLIFLHNPNQVLTRQQLLTKMWDEAGEFVNDNTLTVYIKRLREKLEDDLTQPTYIVTVRGLGYKLGEATC